MARLLHVIGVQSRPVPGDPAATLEKLEREVTTLGASFPEAQLYVFPELWLTGDHPFRHVSPMRDLAEPIPGPLTKRLGAIARRARRWICAGSIYERAGDRVYNTALVFSPKGELAARYRKLYPWMPFEACAPGDEPAPVFDIPRVGRLGLMICYDGWYPEVARGLAVRGAEVIVHPTLTTTPDREEELVLARARAIENQCYVINVNAVVEVGGGRSIAVDPEGRVIFEGGSGEEYLGEVLDLDRVQTVRERGTRGLNRVLRQFMEDSPAAVFEPYRKRPQRRRPSR
ncbi:hydrolase [Sorangium cellulosum]|uniref:Hydrolase n=1 Tax=Sorangium cellulosum TaxID=56 RepID=A0A2L0FC23_SORCE|nr:carbon-nitrogen hydrolase family protein [Sorangium cellulosum]AUX49022.1 hydrolase [Sorangium cellulosum]